MERQEYFAEQTRQRVPNIHSNQKAELQIFEVFSFTLSVFVKLDEFTWKLRVRVLDYYW